MIEFNSYEFQRLLPYIKGEYGHFSKNKKIRNWCYDVIFIILIYIVILPSLRGISEYLFYGIIASISIILLVFTIYYNSRILNFNIDSIDLSSKISFFNWKVSTKEIVKCTIVKENNAKYAIKIIDKNGKKYRLGYFDELLYALKNKIFKEDL